MAIRATLRRYHVWLGWLVGIPMLFWTVSGLMMVAKPIEEVRGTDLLRPLAPVVSTADVILPIIDGRSLKSMRLESRADGPRWVLEFADGATRLADARTGSLLPALSAADAAREIASRYTGKASIVATRRVDPRHPPLEFRRDTPAWQVEMSDDTHFFVDAGNGDVIARRTGWWRVYDFFWGLHIMDLQGREETSNPWVVTFGALATVMALLAIVLLPMTGRRRRPKQA
ncbi:PepSY domain-containing protein [Sphingomonas jaspsi]|uniref:PepSY domain-containing protein n=1 Tax=Sphingomonas jaspsi TaxID=392409 RepID=UPI0004B912DF|nr:PepSY domain-containing protein [Sphingomonas jaspsi]